MSNRRHAAKPWLGTGEARYDPVAAAEARAADVEPPEAKHPPRARHTSTIQHAVQIVRKIIPGTGKLAAVTVNHGHFYGRLDNDQRLYTYERQRGIGSGLTPRQARRIRKRKHREP